MEEETLNNIINSINTKLGEDTSALISDDIATLITQNNLIIENTNNKDKEIENLQKQNKTLITANGNLLQQVSYTKPIDDKEKDDKEEKKEIKISDIFDDKGNFK